VVVGVTQAGGCHFDQEFALARAFELKLDHLPLSRLIEQNCCFRKGPRMNNLSDPRAVCAGHDGVTAQTILAQALSNLTPFTSMNRLRPIGAAAGRAARV
jgi:hypothetical protein